MADGFSWERFYQLPVIGILRGFGPPAVREITRASVRGGLKNVEVTMNSPGAEDLIRLVLEESAGTMNVGAGTVCSPDDLGRAVSAGATFIVTPVVVPDVIAACLESGVPVIPGALTPTEIHNAWRLGADLVKVFPANRLGPGYIKDVKGPLAGVKLVPTGGVTVETLPDYRRAGADAFGVGSPLFDPEKVAAGDWEWVAEQARRFVEAYRRSAYLGSELTNHQ